MTHALPSAVVRDEKAHVLIVEDDRDNREALAQYLRAVGFAVTTVADGGRALDHIVRAQPSVVLMDLKLRGNADGWQISRRLKADPRTRTIPIVAVSACVFPEDVDRALASGCEAFVPKPFDLAALVQTIDEVIDGGSR